MLHSPQLSRRLIANYAITDALQRRHDGLVRNASIDQSRRVFTSVNEKEESGRKKKQKNDACVKNTTAISTHPLVSRHKQSSSIPKLNTRNVWNVVSEIRNESEQIRDTANGSTGRRPSAASDSGVITIQRLGFNSHSLLGLD